MFGSIILSTISLSTKREENLGLSSILTSMTMSDYWQTLPRRRMNLMRGKSLKEATINETSIFSPRLDGRLVPNAWMTCKNPNLRFEFRFSIQRRIMESTQLPESLFLIILDCVVLNTPLSEFNTVNDAYSLHSHVRDPICFVSEDLAWSENMLPHGFASDK